MKIFNTFIDEYATAILYTLITAIFGALAAFIKKKYKEWADSKTKRQYAKDVITFVEQRYKALPGAVKKERAVEALTDMLTEKGINISKLEIDILLEAAVGEANGVFDFIKTYDGPEEEEIIIDDPEPEETFERLCDTPYVPEDVDETIMTMLDGGVIK